jgi:flagellar motor switch protein FliM
MPDRLHRSVRGHRPSRSVAATAVPVAEARVRSYDFRRAMRFSRDHVRILMRIHEDFARMWAPHLSAELRTGVQLRLESVEEVRYDEFIGVIPGLTLIQVLRMSPTEGSIVIQIDLSLAFAMVDRLIGGPGTGPYQDRELTTIEQSLLRRVLSVMTDDMSAAWRSVVPHVGFERGPMEHNPQFLQVAMPNETVLVVTFDAQIGTVRGLVNLCLPHVTLKPVLPALGQHRGGGTVSGEVQSASDRLMPHLESVTVTVSAELGRAHLSLRELLELRTGDVIRLEQPLNKPILVRVDGIPAYEASVGTAHRHYAVKVVHEWTGGTDDDG